MNASRDNWEYRAKLLSTVVYYAVLRPSAGISNISAEIRAAVELPMRDIGRRLARAQVIADMRLLENVAVLIESTLIETGRTDEAAAIHEILERNPL